MQLHCGGDALASEFHIPDNAVIRRFLLLRVILSFSARRSVASAVRSRVDHLADSADFAS